MNIWAYLYLVELFLNAAGIQPQRLVLVLFHPFDDLDHLMIVFSTDLVNMSEVDVVGDQASFNVSPQQSHNLIGVSIKIQNKHLGVIDSYCGRSL